MHTHVNCAHAAALDARYAHVIIPRNMFPGVVDRHSKFSIYVRSHIGLLSVVFRGGAWARTRRVSAALRSAHALTRRCTELSEPMAHDTEMGYNAAPCAASAGSAEGLAAALRRVEFEKNAKLYDGMSQASLDFDALWERYFASGRLETAEALITSYEGSMSRLQELVSRCEDYVMRLEDAAADVAVPVLPRGGGGGLKLPRDRMQIAVDYMDIVRSAAGRVRAQSQCVFHAGSFVAPVAAPVEKRAFLHEEDEQADIIDVAEVARGDAAKRRRLDVPAPQHATVPGATDAVAEVAATTAASVAGSAEEDSEAACAEGLRALGRATADAVIDSAEDALAEAAGALQMLAFVSGAPAASGAVAPAHTRKARKRGPTHKEHINGRCVRWCDTCMKHVNYKNYSHHMRDIHSKRTTAKAGDGALMGAVYVTLDAAEARTAIV